MNLGLNRIAVKLAGGFGFCVLLMAALIAFNVNSLQKLERLYRETAKHSAAMELALDAEHTSDALGVVIGHAVINRDLARSEKEWVATKRETLERLQKLKGVADIPEEKAIIGEVQSVFDGLVRIYEQEMLPLITKGVVATGSVSEVDARIDSRLETMGLALERIRKIESEDNQAASREFHAVLTEMIRSGLVIALSGVMTAILIAVLTTRRIVRPLLEMTGAAREMEKGNYPVELKHRSNDETGVLANAFRGMAGQVQRRTAELEASNTQLSREVAERKQAEDEIRKLNSGLEQRVAERTAELTAHVEMLSHEVAERTRAEKALKQSEELLRVVLEILPVGIWVVGRGGGSIVMSNRAGKSIWCGEQYCDLEMATEFKGWRPGTGERLRKEEWAVSRALTTGETTLNEVVDIECFDGSRKTIANSAVPIRSGDNEIIAAVEVVEDITERYRAEERLKASHEQLRNLSARLDAALETERGRIAREIHDELGQLLTVLKFDASWLRGKIAGLEPGAAERVASMNDLIDTTISTVQRIATELRPKVLDHLGLAAAIEWYVQNFQRRTGIACHLDVVDDELPIDERGATALFRICQESLTNVMRHAGASQVEVKLALKGSRVHLEVADDGRGIGRKELADPRSVGLVGMRERVHLLGGKLSISGVRGKGTKVKVTIPVIDRGRAHDQDSHSG